jgi:predicted aminopeptidase
MSRLLLIGLLLFGITGSSGCYYSHLARGQLALLWARRPIEEARADPALPQQTREMLGLVESVRVFGRELGLAVGDQYTRYVDWPGDRIVTTLVRTRAGTLEAVPYRFPLVGALPYKGYFDFERAERAAERLRDESYDVCISGVTAYSTLGWFDDPVTGPMTRRGADRLVETILHELVHATAFVPEEVAFNESVAQFIGQEAAVRFFEALEVGSIEAPAGAWPSSARVRALIEDRREIARVMLAFRDRLVELEGHPDRARRRRIEEEEARAELASLSLRVLSPERVARAARLSDACLALRGTYVEDLPRHAAVLEALDGNLVSLIARLSLWSEEARSVEEFFVVGDDGRDRKADRVDALGGRSATGQLDHAFLDETPEDL